MFEPAPAGNGGGAWSDRHGIVGRHPTLGPSGGHFDPGDLARSTDAALHPNAAAWYRKHEPTFSDAIVAVRRVLWCPLDFSISRQSAETVEIPSALLKRVFQTLCLAA
jgi:hypothetical protein